MRNVFYVLGSIAAIIISVSLTVVLILIFDPQLVYKSAVGSAASSGSDSAELTAADAKTDHPNRASLNELIQLRPDGTALALAFSTPKIARRYYFGTDSFISDNRDQARECLKKQASQHPPDVCQYGSQFSRENSILSDRFAYYAKNAVLLLANGQNEILFDTPVTILHGEFAVGSSNDYLVMSYVDEDTSKDGKLDTLDRQKLAVLSLATLKLSKIALPGSLSQLQSIVGDGDTFQFTSVTDVDNDGKFDPRVEPERLFSVDFATGKVTPIISEETVGKLQKQLDSAAIAATSGQRASQ